MLWAGKIMKLALHHSVALATLAAALLAVTGATDQYDPLKQQCFQYSMRCSPLLLTSKDANHQQQYSNWAGLSDEHRHVQSSQHLLMASCNMHASEIEGLVDAGGCMVEVTAIAAITDGCLAGVSVFTVNESLPEHRDVSLPPLVQSASPDVARAYAIQNSINIRSFVNNVSFIVETAEHCHDADHGDIQVVLPRLALSSVCQVCAISEKGQDVFARSNIVPTSGAFPRQLRATEQDASRASFRHQARQLANSLVHGPYLQSVGTTSAVIVWRTATPDVGVVFLGSSPTSLTTKFSAKSSSTDAAVTVTGLKPSTLYYYSIGSNTGTLASGSAYSFRTTPSLGSTASFRALMLGDPGTLYPVELSVYSALQSYLASKPPNAWFLLGDNAYQDGTSQEYSSKVFQVYQNDLRSMPMWSIIGNHDRASSITAGVESGPYFSMFQTPKAGESGGVPSGSGAYFAVDYGAVHIVCLDSWFSDTSPTGAMATWLQRDLAALKPATTKWLIALWHHPPYSQGTLNSDSDAKMVEMRTRILPILESAGVDVVIGGHCHGYERSQFLNGHYGKSSTFSSSFVVPRGSGTASDPYTKPLGVTPNSGMVSVVTGSAGQVDKSTAGMNHPANVPLAGRRGAAVAGFFVVDVVGNTLTGTFVTDAGSVLDQFVIKKAVIGTISPSPSPLLTMLPSTSPSLSQPPGTLSTSLSASATAFPSRTSSTSRSIGASLAPPSASASVLPSGVVVPSAAASRSPAVVPSQVNPSVSQLPVSRSRSASTSVAAGSGGGALQAPASSSSSDIGPMIVIIAGGAVIAALAMFFVVRRVRMQRHHDKTAAAGSHGHSGGGVNGAGTVARSGVAATLPVSSRSPAAATPSHRALLEASPAASTGQGANGTLSPNGPLQQVMASHSRSQRSAKSPMTASPNVLMGFSGRSRSSANKSPAPSPPRRKYDSRVRPGSGARSRRHSGQSWTVAAASASPGTPSPSPQRAQSRLLAGPSASSDHRKHPWVVNVVDGSPGHKPEGSATRAGKAGLPGHQLRRHHKKNRHHDSQRTAARMRHGRYNKSGKRSEVADMSSESDFSSSESESSSGLSWLDTDTSSDDSSNSDSSSSSSNLNSQPGKHRDQRRLPVEQAISTRRLAQNSNYVPQAVTASASTSYEHGNSAAYLPTKHVHVRHPSAVAPFPAGPFNASQNLGWRATGLGTPVAAPLAAAQSSTIGDNMLPFLVSPPPVPKKKLF